MKRERWGSPLVQEKYQEEKACDERQPYRIMMMIIIIIIIIIIRIKMLKDIRNLFLREVNERLEGGEKYSGK